MDFFQLFLDLGKFLLVVGIVFTVLVAIASHLRFQMLTAEVKKKEGRRIDSRSAFELSIAHLLGTVHRAPEPFCVLLAVPRNVEALVQAHGEALANEILEGVRIRFRKHLRANDVVSIYHDNRIGAIVNTERSHAARLIQRLGEQVSSENYKCKSGLVLPLKIAIGLVSYPENGDRVQSLLEGAERALKQAAEEERGGHVLSGESESGAETDASVDSRTSGESKLIDPLTGLLKPSKVGSIVQKYVARYRRKGDPVSMLIMEIDHLDRYAEHYGDEAKSEILKRMGQFLQETLREDDLLARLSDEEFLVVMGCAPVDAQQAGRRLVNQIRRTPFTVGGSSLRIALSIGIAGYPDHGGTTRYLLECADMALNFVRENGRGMCMRFEPRMSAAATASSQADVF